MSKCLKKYNTDTGKWEIISPTSSDYIAVSNTSFNNESSSISTLTDVLNNMGKDINKLKRNVSWLAEHGGGGGFGGGNNPASTYTIKVSGVKDNKLYVSTTKFEFTFSIEGGKVNDIVEYQVFYDGRPLEKETIQTTVNKNNTVEINNIDMYGEDSVHTVEIRAIDSNNFIIPSFVFEILKSSIVIKCNTINTLPINEPTFDVYVTNKLLGTELTIIVKSVKGEQLVKKYPCNSAEEIEYPITVTAEMMGDTLVPGKEYNLTIDAQVVIDGVIYPAERPCNTKIQFISDSTIVIATNGLCSKSEYEEDANKISKFTTQGNLSFSFTPYLQGETQLYYAVKLTSMESDTVHVIAGVENGEYYKNVVCQSADYIRINRYLNKDDYIGKWYIDITVWSGNGGIEKTSKYVCEITKGVQSHFDLQIPKRDGSSVQGHTCYAHWDINNFPDTSNAAEWKSEMDGYLEKSATETTRIVKTIQAFNINGKENGFIRDENCLRLTNKAYAEIEIDNTMVQNWLNKDGFTLSITFKSDFHPYNDRTIFMWGNVDSNDKFIRGIKIDLEYVYWYFAENISGQAGEKYLKVPIQQNVLNTVDFIYEHINHIDHQEGVAKIFINGKLYSAAECKTYVENNSFPDKIYLGCGINNDKSIINFSDVNIYSLSIFSKYLNDLQVIINSHNARAERDDYYQIDTVKYTDWKRKNFFSLEDEDNIQNTLFDIQNGKYSNVNFYSFNEKNTTLPVLWLDCGDSKFTSDIYYTPYINAEEATATKYDKVKLHYFDPTKDKTIEADVAISIQGTSTTSYRSKNLELYFTKPINDSTQDVELFQPKDDWFPESQFTLKADVVDSAHANNTTIGKWINTVAVEQGILEDTPPMKVVRENPPKKKWKGEDGVEQIDGSYDIKVKHTLEGFPIILLITFKDETITHMLGIYSFNLGRFSYYNMGMSFLKSFSRMERNPSSGIYEDKGTPALIKDYEYYKREESISGINLSNIYSYEFGAGGNVNRAEYPTWSQEGIHNLKVYGEFKFNGAQGGYSNPGDNVWEELNKLFGYTARISPTSYKYSNVNGDWVQDGENRYESNDANIEELCKSFSIKNAMAYFVIANAFGMVDSLGKNLTLRSWNVGEDGMKWYPCFYDMDTALGITNEGDENVSSTVFIDEYKNNDDGVINNLLITRNKENVVNGFNAYNSKLWNILRSTEINGDNSLFKRTGYYSEEFYEDVWSKLRRGALENVNDFITSLTKQTEGCGEILFNYDYNIKYLTKYKAATSNSSSTETYGDIGKLHGDRVEYIRKWLTDRFIFLDGVFEVSVGNPALPYYTIGKATISPKQKGTTNLFFTVTSPAILKLNAGSDNTIYKYFLPAYEKTEIRFKEITTQQRLNFNLMPIITEFDGLKDAGFIKFEDCKFPKFSILDLSDVDTINADNFKLENLFVKNGTSELRELKLTNVDTEKELTLILSDFDKINEIDISYSNVGSIVLPTTPLSELKFNNSKIKTLTISSQPYLDELDFSGCNDLTEITINDCNGITNLDIKKLANLKSISIKNCANLETITCTDNTTLDTIVIHHNENLKNINFSGCSNPNAEITILTCHSLENLNLEGVQTTKPITLPEKVDKIKSLKLKNCVGLSAFKYSSNEITKYEEEDVLDLRPFKNLSSANLTMTNCAKVKYIMVNNEEDKYFDLKNSYFSGCALLTRIFGNFKIKGYSVFGGCSNFKIHEEDNYDRIPDNIEFKEGENVTNLTVDSNNLTECFRGTNCSLSDVYYILGQCDNVKNLSSTFSGCTNVSNNESQPIDREIFKHCQNVTTMASLFYGCNLRGPLKSPNGDEKGIMSYCKALKTFTTTFHPTTNLFIDDKFFCKTVDDNELEITDISYFSPKTVKDSNATSLVEDYIDTTNLLAHLPKLVNLSDSFNRGKYNFISDKKYGCDLLYNNTNLKTITECFNGITAKGTCKNLLGGYDTTKDVKDHFPQELKTIKASFIINSGSLNFYIGNSFLQKINRTIECIMGPNAFNDTAKTSSFNGSGMYKYIDTEPGEKTYPFPYKIFSGCTNLKAAPALLRNLRRDNNDFNGEVITLPMYENDFKEYVSMFEDTPKITNISYLFSEMSNIKYRLMGGGFKHTSLINVEGVFAEESSGNNKEGMIPYGLFYQEKTVSYNYSGITQDVAIALGIENEGYGIEKYNGENGNIPQLEFDNEGNITANKTYPDGLIITKNLDSKGYETDEDAENIYLSPTGSVITISGTCITHNPTITNMSSFMANSRSSEITNYVYDISSNEINYDTGTQTYKCGDLVIDNPNYNPIKFFINSNYDPRIYKEVDGELIINPDYDPRRVLYNPNFDPYKKMWNKWITDGSDNLKESIKASELYRLITGGTLKDLPSNLDKVFIEVSHDEPEDKDIWNYNNITDCEWRKNFNIRTYFTAPDIFRYCKPTCIIKQAFYNCGGPDMGDTINEYYHMQYGIKGVIPEFIFEPVKETEELNGVFYHCNSILPYKWGSITDNGVMYPPKLFSGMKQLKNISEMFSYHNIYKRCYIPLELFNDNRNLSDLSKLFLNAHWKDDDNQQIPKELFNNNRNITNVSEMLCRSSTTQEANSTPAKMDKDLFTKTTHNKIKNCERFMCNCSRVSGEVPEFWNFRLTNFNECYKGINPDKVSNFNPAEHGQYS